MGCRAHGSRPTPDLWEGRAGLPEAPEDSGQEQIVEVQQVLEV